MNCLGSMFVNILLNFVLYDYILIFFTCTLPVQILSMSEFNAMTTSRPETPKQKAKALFDFKGQSDKELTLQQVQAREGRGKL